MTPPPFTVACTNLFPTPVFTLEVKDAAALNRELLARIADLRAEDPGVRRTNPLGWHSADTLFTRPAFAPLAALVEDAVTTVAQAMGYQGVRLRLANAWAAVNPRNAGHDVHDHPNGILSGVYYVRTPEPLAAITFHDPRPAKAFFKPRLEVPAGMYTADSRSYAAKEGTMLIFPSWLRHGVAPNESDAERIAISFNYTLG